MKQFASKEEEKLYYEHEASEADFLTGIKSKNAQNMTNLL